MLLTTRQGAAAPIQQAVQSRERVQDARERLFLGLTGIGRPGQTQIIERAQARQDAASLRHIADAHPAANVCWGAGDINAVHHNPATATGHQAHDGFHQRTLAHAVMTDDTDRLAFEQLQGNSMQYRHAAVTGAQLGHIQNDVTLAFVHIAPAIVNVALAFARTVLAIAHFARLPM